MRRAAHNPLTAPAVTDRPTGVRRVALFSVLAALLFVPVPAEAQYLDPGAASIIVQAVVAGVVAVAAAVKLYWSKISGLFSRRRRSDKRP